MSEVKTTSKSAENEIVIYGCITDFSQLKNAIKIIRQEQYEVKPAEEGKQGGRIRVRKETIGGIDSYTLTMKVKGNSESMQSNQEYTVSIDREYFDAFKSIAGNGMIKDRHIFPVKTITVEEQEINVDGICYEVDVFLDSLGNYYSWCKIDFELDKLTGLLTTVVGEDVNFKINTLITSLPFKPTNVFTDKSADDKQKAILDYLYKNVFTVSQSK